MSAYRALARKYRSRHFGELIGQEALVRTLSNAIGQGRLHHAYMFTGIRGTGKTSTARILARAINYAGPDGTAGPTIGPTDDCPICRAIGEDRHPDIIEIDAASNTSVDDVRQIIDNVRYAPVQARYKVFIIDEVHMLSKNAFNALLKTLEEPPPHVVFMLATTEIRKVPATILSRCQRFDLRRVETATLVEHYRKIAGAENIAVDDEALQMIARAAGGSVRDGLSIFDQAIAQANGEPITAVFIRAMLGQADESAVAELFAELMQGDMEAVLARVQTLYEMGADPSALLDDLLHVTHLVTRFKVTPNLLDDISIGTDLRRRADALASQLTLSALSRVWQMLLKAVPELAQASSPRQALEMALIRIGFAADLPPLEELLKRGTGHAQPAPQTASAETPPQPPAPRLQAAAPALSPVLSPVLSVAHAAPRAAAVEAKPQAQPTSALNSLADVVALCETRSEPMLAADLYANVRPVKFQQGYLEIVVLPGAARDLLTALQKKLTEWTGQRWLISVASQGGQQTLREQEQATRRQAIEKAYDDPAILAIKTVLPGITITDIKTEPDP